MVFTHWKVGISPKAWNTWDTIHRPQEAQEEGRPKSSVLSLTHPFGNLCSFQWLAVGIHLCICQTVAEPLKKKLYQAPVSKHFVASTIVSWFGVCIWDGSPGGAVSGWPFLSLYSTLYLLIYSLEYFVPASKKEWCIPTLNFIPLEFHLVCGFYLGYSELLC